jgi:hypothetical protein
MAYVYLLGRSGRPVFEPPTVIINPWVAIAYWPGTLFGLLSSFMTWLRL